WWLCRFEDKPRDGISESEVVQFDGRIVAIVRFQKKCVRLRRAGEVNGKEMLRIGRAFPVGVAQLVAKFATPPVRQFFPRPDASLEERGARTAFEPCHRQVR